MLYCESCHAVFSSGDRCPLCHKGHVREAQDADLCFFSEHPSFMASVVENLLHQNGLRFITRPVYGAGISAVTGQFLESIRFYTTYNQYARACELMETMFPDKEDEEKKELDS